VKARVLICESEKTFHTVSIIENRYYKRKCLHSVYSLAIRQQQLFSPCLCSCPMEIFSSMQQVAFGHCYMALLTYPLPNWFLFETTFLIYLGVTSTVNVFWVWHRPVLYEDTKGRGHAASVFTVLVCTLRKWLGHVGRPTNNNNNNNNSLWVLQS
jgi:hypothetical protein